MLTSNMRINKNRHSKITVYSASWHFFSLETSNDNKKKGTPQKCTIIACKITFQISRSQAFWFRWAHWPFPSFNGCRCSYFLTCFCFHLISLSLAITSGTPSAYPAWLTHSFSVAMTSSICPWNEKKNP